jgi:hypothetical protein
MRSAFAQGAVAAVAAAGSARRAHARTVGARRRRAEEEVMPAESARSCRGRHGRRAVWTEGPGSGAGAAGRLYERSGGRPSPAACSSRGPEALPFRLARDVAQPGRAPRLGRGGRRFESGHPDGKRGAAREAAFVHAAPAEPQQIAHRQIQAPPDGGLRVHPPSRPDAGRHRGPPIRSGRSPVWTIAALPRRPRPRWPSPQRGQRRGVGARNGEVLNRLKVGE